MVLESVSLAWDGISIHCPEIYLDNQIERLSPGWKVKERSDDSILLKNDALDAVLGSDYKGTKAMCRGTYGGNLKSIRNVGDTIKSVAGFYRMSGINSKLAKKECEFMLVAGGESCDVVGLTNLNYDPKYFGNKNFRNVQGKLPKPFVTLIDGLPAITWMSNYHRIMDEYEHTFPKVFQFRC
jgi:hypothetical protein